MRNMRHANPPLAAIVGGIVWAALLGLSVAGRFPLTIIQLIFLLAPLVIIPLGLRVVDPSHVAGAGNTLYDWARNLQPPGAALAVASFYWHRGYTAASLAVGWLVVCGLVGLFGLLRLRRNGLGSAGQTCASVGLIYLPIGGVGLAASRLGWGIMNFKEPIVLLTAVHFHYAGFAAPLLVGATGRAVNPDSRVMQKLLRWAAWGVMVAPGLVAAGFLVSPLLKVLSAFILAASLTVLSVLTLEAVPQIGPKISRWLLVISALSIPAAMMLVCVYAVGDFTGHELISIPQMAAFHGITNSFGFTLCGFLAWSMTGRQKTVAHASTLEKAAAIPVGGRMS
jgi:YndJ-like protein